MKKETLFSILKSISRTGFIIFFALALFNFGAVYGKYSEGNEGVLVFATKEQTITYNMAYPPEYLTRQINDYNKITNDIYGAIIFSFLVMFFDYFLDKKNHFITKIKEKLAPKLEEISGGLEDGEP